MPGEQNQYTLAEVALRNGNGGSRTWIILSDIVYDVTNYMEDHPGGSELITEWAGKDGTKDFDDFGHSSEAMRLLKPLQIGVLVESDRAKNRQSRGSKKVPSAESEDDLTTKKRSKRRRFILCG